MGFFMKYNMKQGFFFLWFLTSSGLSFSVFWKGFICYLHIKSIIPLPFIQHGLSIPFYFLFFMPYALMLIPVFIQRKNVSSKSGKVFIKISLLLLAKTLTGMISFAIMFENILKNRGILSTKGFHQFGRQAWLLNILSATWQMSWCYFVISLD